MRARQEFQRQQKGRGKGHPTDPDADDDRHLPGDPSPVDSGADDDSEDNNWGNWRDPNERSGPPAPGAFQSGQWTNDSGYRNPYPQEQTVDDPHPGYRMSANGYWRLRRQTGDPRRGVPRARDQARGSDDHREYDTQ